MAYIEENGRMQDIYTRLLKDRIIFIGSAIDAEVSNDVVGKLLFLAMNDSKKDINIYINSPGGCVVSGMAIYDTIKAMPCDVSTTIVGMAASMGAVIFSGGTKGKRFALPNSRFMIHQPLGGTQGQASDLTIYVKKINQWKDILYKILAENSGQSVKKIEKDSDRDYWMNPSEAVKYGFVDEIITKL